MSDELDDDLDNEGGSQLVKDLRSQLKAAKKQADEAKAEAEQFRAAQRKASVSDLLTAKGVKPGLARFYDGEPTEEAVTSWLAENADLFGVTVEDEVDSDLAASAAKISQASANAPIPKIGSREAIMAQLSGAKTRADLDAAYAAAGIKFDA